MYPIHPIDLTKVSVEGDALQLVCYRTLICSEPSVQGRLSVCFCFASLIDIHNRIDFLLGDTFIRNIYTLCRYPDAHGPNEAAYIQMRSVHV